MERIECKSCSFIDIRYNRFKSRMCWCCMIDRCDCDLDRPCHVINKIGGLSVKDAIRILHYYQKWRRPNYNGNIPMPKPALVGLAIDEAMRMLRSYIRLEEAREEFKNALK